MTCAIEVHTSVLSLYLHKKLVLYVLPPSQPPFLSLSLYLPPSGIICVYTGHTTHGEGSVGRRLVCEPQIGLATNPAYALPHPHHGAQPPPVHGRRSTTAQYNMNINPSYLLGTPTNVGYLNSNSCTANEYDYPAANNQTSLPMHSRV